MSSPDGHPQRWLHLWVFGLWTCSLAYLLFTQRYTGFLRPEFGLLLGIALFISVWFTVVSMRGERGRRIDFSGIMRALVLVVPILYLMIMPEATLGTDSFKKRFIDPNFMASGRPAESNLPVFDSEKRSEPSLELENEKESAQERLEEATILEILTNAARYQEKRVSVIGMIFHDEQGKKLYLGKNKTVLYRFQISCCAADALPFGIIVDSEHAAEFKNDQWVRVEGTFKMTKSGLKWFPVLKRAAITAIDAPKMPYLF